MPLGYTREMSQAIYDKHVDKLKLFDLSTREYLEIVYMCIDIEKGMEINKIRMKYKLKFQTNKSA